MSFERYVSEIPMRVEVLQAFNHGPVYVRAPGLMQAYCVHKGCLWKGPVRVGGSYAEQIEADAKAHLLFETNEEWSE